jgi:hypothetical protein
MRHLPLRLSPEPHHPGAAIHSITWSLHVGTCIMPIDSNTTTSLSYGVPAANFAQVYMSPTPYNDAFEEELDLRKFNFSRHRTAGMTFLPQDNRLILASMVQSTLGACVPCWRTQLQGAWLLSINDNPVQTLVDVHKAFHDLSLSQQASCILLFAHPEISHGISNKGLLLLCCDLILQLSIDQLSDCWTPQSQHPPVLPTTPTWDILIDGDVWNVVTKVMKLTRGKLIKQDDWTEWNESEHLQLNQYDNNSCLEIQFVRTTNRLFSTSFGHTLLKNSMGERKLVVFATDLLVLDRSRSLTTLMPTALTEWAHAYSMPYPRPKICWYMARTS